MPPGSRGGEKAGRGTRGARGGRARGASQSATSRPSSDDPVPSSETASLINDNTPDPGNKPEAPSGRSTPVGLRTSQTPATTSRGTSRFKPKNVRRDEAERKKLEEDRSRDLASKIKAEERELRAEERRARRGRGRGGASRGGLIRRTVTASGPFSAIASGMSRLRVLFGHLSLFCLLICMQKMSRQALATVGGHLALVLEEGMRKMHLGRIQRTVFATSPDGNMNLE